LQIELNNLVEIMDKEKELFQEIDHLFYEEIESFKVNIESLSTFELMQVKQITK